MNTDKQRIAIAEACGWKHVLRDPLFLRGRRPGEEYGLEVIPDYLNDLNAMHEAEQVCIINKCETRYSAFLYDEIPCGTPAWCATAAQRAEAFLRTIGKWEDDK